MGLAIPVVGERSRNLKFSTHHQDQSTESSSNEREGVHLHTLEDQGMTRHCNSWQKRSSHTQCKLIPMHTNDSGALQLVLFNKRMMTQDESE